MTERRGAAPFISESKSASRRLGVLGRLFARFDLHVLDAPPSRPSGRIDKDDSNAPQRQPGWMRLAEWCGRALGDGRVPLWRPWAPAVVTRRLDVALWASDAIDAGTAGNEALVAAFCRHIDGTDQLLSIRQNWRRLIWRAQIKLREAQWWHGGGRRLPWDAGYLRLDALALTQLAAWRPRRPTLIVATDLDSQVLGQVLQTLRQQQAAFDQPVRVLVVAPRSVLSHCVGSVGLAGTCEALN